MLIAAPKTMNLREFREFVLQVMTNSALDDQDERIKLKWDIEELGIEGVEPGPIRFKREKFAPGN